MTDPFLENRRMPPASPLTVRPAQESDAAAIAAIYNQGIEERIATFETEPRSPAAIRAALAERGDRYPTLVAERDGAVVAAAWLGPYRPRPCYDGIAEYSVYTARDARGTGAGRAVLAALLAESERRGFWKVLSRIFPENTASRALCRSLGFREVGVYYQHARLDGVWRDCVIVEKLLGGFLGKGEEIVKAEQDPGKSPSCPGPHPGGLGGQGPARGT
jgi:phosphinothricin acetyltransferase